jgi:hypothetical protein
LQSFVSRVKLVPHHHGKACPRVICEQGTEKNIWTEEI